MVGELSGEFSVSEETIRRDLECLENEGLAKRTYGGAVLSGGEKSRRRWKSHATHPFPPPDGGFPGNC